MEHSFHARLYEYYQVPIRERSLCVLFYLLFDIRPPDKFAGHYTVRMKRLTRFLRRGCTWENVSNINWQGYSSGRGSATMGHNGIVCTGPSHDEMRRDCLCGTRLSWCSSGRDPAATGLSCAGSGLRNTTLLNEICVYWSRPFVVLWHRVRRSRGAVGTTRACSLLIGRDPIRKVTPRLLYTNIIRTESELTPSTKHSFFNYLVNVYCATRRRRKEGGRLLSMAWGGCR